MATSVPGERAFSIAGLTITDNRARLNPEAVDEIIFMNKALHKKYAEEKPSNVEEERKPQVDLGLVKQETEMKQ